MSATAPFDPPGPGSGPESYRAACRELEGAIRELRIRQALMRWRSRGRVMQRARLLLAEAARSEDGTG